MTGFFILFFIGVGTGLYAFILACVAWFDRVNFDATEWKWQMRHLLISGMIAAICFSLVMEYR
jgi:hypothetical protein